MTATSRRRVTATVALTLALVALVAVIARGDPDPPMTPDTVAASLSGETSGIGHGSCTQIEPRRWSCSVPDAGGSTVAEYELTATSDGCWEARLTRRAERSPATAEGCVD